MTKRMGIALIALVGALIATYLTLYKLGVIGTLVCSNLGSCETVQTSRWATFLGLPVAAWGVGYYLAILIAAIVGTMPAWSESRGVSVVLLLMTAWGFLFSAYLTSLELFVIHAICVYCVTSAILVTVLLVLSWLDYRETRVLAGEVVA